MYQDNYNQMDSSHENPHNQHPYHGPPPHGAYYPPHEQMNTTYNQNYGQPYNEQMTMNQNMATRVHDWSDRTGNWGAMPAGHDSGIHTRDSSAAPSVMSSAYSAFSAGSNYSESHQVDWTRYGNQSRKDDELSVIKAQIDNQLATLKTVDDVEPTLQLIKNYLFDSDLRCIHMASKETWYRTSKGILFPVLTLAKKGSEHTL